MPSPTRRRSLRIESLERRTVPSTATLSQGTLAVTGTVVSDTIVVQEVNGRLLVTGTPIQVGGSFFNSVSVGAVSRIYIAGLTGNDVIDVHTVSKPATIIGGRGNDRITGGLAGDQLFGRDGNDTIAAGTGNDSLYGENGDDSVAGDDGDDSLFGGTGNDSLAGGDGNDTVYCEAGNDIAEGGDGNDVLRGNVGNDQLTGGAGNDRLVGEDGDDLVDGSAGDDTASGGYGNDTVVGSDGNDSLTGEEGDDSLDGGAGNDSVSGGFGNDQVFGGAGDDALRGEYGSDTLNGGAGNDSLMADEGDAVDGGGGADTIIGGGGTGGDPGGTPGGGSNATGTVLQVIRSQWFDGTTNDITVRNTSTTTMNGWKVEFDADFEVTDVWNAQLVDHAGNHYTFTNLPNHWAATIRPNTQITFGFNTHLSPDDTTAIHNIELNDQPLASDSGTGNGGTVPATGTVSQVVRSVWFEGSTHDVTVKNTGTTAINGWTVSFDADFDITEVWNAQLVGRVGNRYTIRNIPNFWNARILPGTEVTFGFNTRLGLGDSTGIREVTLTANNP